MQRTRRCGERGGARALTPPSELGAALVLEKKTASWRGGVVGGRERIQFSPQP